MKETKFKQTEVGMIPSDWEVKTVGKLLKIGHGKDYKNLKSGNVPVYGTGGYMTSVDKYLYDGETVCIGRKGTIDKPFYHIGKIWTVDTLFYTFGFNGCIPKFIYYAFGLVDWLGMNEASGVPSLTSKNIEDVLLRIPPTIEEQQRIASALSDVDTLIANLEKLIAKKKNIKQGAMQQLLTGKKRLPGFAPAKPTYKQTELGKIPSDWEVKTFGDVGKGFSAGATPYRQVDRYYEGDIKWVSSGELDYNVIQETQEHISIEAVKVTNLTLHPKNTFLMAITGLEAAGTRGRCAILGCEATTNQSCLAIYESEYLSIPYLYHFYVKYGDALAFAYAQGSKQQSFTAAIVKKLPIILPSSKAEQTAIANVLSDMDAEIATLETKLAKYRQLKTGMMQQLLTGKIRLV